MCALTLPVSLQAVLLRSETGESMGGMSGYLWRDTPSAGCMWAGGGVGWGGKYRARHFHFASRIVKGK